MKSEKSKIKNREYMRKYNLKYYAKNKDDVLARNRKYAKEHPEIMAKVARDYRQRYPDRQKNSRLKYKYGISLEDYQKLLDSQNGVCAICWDKNIYKKTLVVDHCHTSDKVRGLLCDNCNLALGLTKDNPEILLRAIKYLNNYL